MFEKQKNLYLQRIKTEAFYPCSLSNSNLFTEIINPNTSIMKKLFLILLLIPALGVTSCVKQKNCEGCRDTERIGWIQYQMEPVTDPFYTNHGRVEVTAIFYFEPNDEWGFPIAGNIPKEYRSGELVRVRACLKYDEGILTTDHIPAAKLTCIEKED